MKHLSVIFVALVMLLMSACVAPLPLAPVAQPEGEEAMPTEEDKIANAMSAGPAAIAQDAAILDYPEDWPGNWPEEVAPELIEIRGGSNGWTCIVDIPDTPGNDPMCLSDVYLESLLAQRNLEDSPSTGVGFGYMLQGGSPVGSPPHMMVFAPGSNESVDTFDMEPGPQPWVMFPETSHQHLMVLVPPPVEMVSAEEDKIANAMSAGPGCDCSGCDDPGLPGGRAGELAG